MKSKEEEETRKLYWIEQIPWRCCTVNFVTSVLVYGSSLYDDTYACDFSKQL